MDKKPLKIFQGGISQARDLPPVFRNVTMVDYFQSFTIWQRIAILFGATNLVVLKILTSNKLGQFEVIGRGMICKSIDKERALLEHQDHIKQMDELFVEVEPKK